MGAYSKSQTRMDIDDSFISSFAPFFADSTYDFASQMLTFDTVLLLAISNLTCKLFRVGKLGVFGGLNLVYVGALYRRVYKNLGSEGRGLLERGLNTIESFIEFYGILSHNSVVLDLNCTVIV